jgi:hypothetical protein
MNILESIYLFLRAILSLLAALPRLLKIRTVRLIVAAAVIILAVAAVYRFLFPPLPKSVEVYNVVWLKQGWTEQQRQRVYHTPQGTLIIPYSWFFALEDKPVLTWPIMLGGGKPFFTNDNVARYRAIPDPLPDYNPDRLPIGVTKAVLSDAFAAQLGQGHKEWLSYTCAFCHTTQMNYKGIGIRIDGGPGNLDFDQFNTMLGNLLVLTAANPARFDRFSEKVLQREGRPVTSEQKESVREELQAFIQSPVVNNGVLAVLNHTYPTKEGFGRMDALGRGVNGQFGPLDSRNVRVANAPVSIPPFWYGHDYGWVQTIGAIRQPMGRNVTEAWGVNAAADLINPDAAKLYASSIDMKNLYWIETLNSVLTPPEWPEGLLGGIDKEAAKRGQYLYEEAVFANALDPSEEQCGPPDCGPLVARPQKGLCARCHAPVFESQQPEPGGPYYALPMYKLNVIGTDPGDATNFNSRTIYTGRLKDVLFDNQESVGIGVAFTKASTAIMQREYKDLNIPADQQPEMNGFRDNQYRAPLAYPARPMAGFWATAPFLHNNSVPTLYQLLSPVKERQSSFWTGDLEFDPVHVGYNTKSLPGGFEFRTRAPFFTALWTSFTDLFIGRFGFSLEISGNSNAGHEFRDAPKGTPGVIGPALDPRQRMDIIEYMKVIRDVPPLPAAELQRREQILDRLKSEYQGQSAQ